MEYKYLKWVDFKEISFWSVAYYRNKGNLFNQYFEKTILKDVLIPSRNIIEIKDEIQYKRITVKVNANGVVLRDEVFGKEIGTKRQFLVKGGEFIVSKIDARNGAFGIIPKILENAIVTNDFPLFNVSEKLELSFLNLLCKTKMFVDFAKTCSSGTTNRQRIDISKFLNFQIPLPSLAEQKAIVLAYQNKINTAQELENEAKNLENQIEKYLFEELGIEQIQEKKEKIKGLQLVEFKDMERWDLWNEPNKVMKHYYPFFKLKDSILPIESKIEKVSKNEYKENGVIPIISQEKEFISGYTDLDVIPIYENQPLILFGDHSQTKKYVDFPFICGADGVRILKPNKKFIPLFFFYYLETIKYETSQKYTRHYKYLCEEKIPVPPLSKQNEIVAQITAMKQAQKDKTAQATRLREEALKEFENLIFE
ncbi:MAG: restriction endonuclease subunit S [Capnocytophaga sp.]|nr:restriction endonuclease subunit S [Capnocytophaga sp.]